MSDSDSSSSSSSSSSEERRRRRKKRRKDKRKRERPSDSGSDSEERHRKKRRHKEKKKKKKKSKKKKNKKKKHNTMGAIDQSAYGSRGIKRKEDYYDMRDEFEAWLREVKNISELPASSREAMELFSTYCEDYNTVTLPEKYYSLEKWERKRQEKAARKLAKRAKNAPVDIAADERFLADQRRLEKKRKAISEAHAQLIHVDKEKAEAMKEQEMMRRRMKFLYNTGEVEEARLLQEKMRSKGGNGPPLPDDDGY